MKYRYKVGFTVGDVNFFMEFYGEYMTVSDAADKIAKCLGASTTGYQERIEED